MGAEDFIDGIGDGLTGGTPTGPTWGWGHRTGVRRDLSDWDAEGIRLARIEARRARRARRRSGRRRWFAPWTRWPVVHPTPAEAEYRARLAKLAQEADQTRNRNPQRVTDRQNLR